MNLTPEKSAAIRREIDLLGQSGEFRNTRRLLHCLRFLVDRVLEGRADVLKERVIGAEVFARSPDYDTGNDAIVRVTANELRKKLAQYYLHEGPHEVRIELPPGSYVPEFTWPQPEKAGVAAMAPHPNGVEHGPDRARLALTATPFRIVVGVLALLATAALLSVLLNRTEASPLERFWAPVLHGAGPIVICLSNPVVYGLSPEVLRSYELKHPQDANAGPFVVPFGDALITGRQIVPITGQYVGNGEAFSLGELTSLFTRLHKPYETRIGGDLSASDLRNRAIIFLGFSSRWNLELSKGLRFASYIENNVKMIRDSASKQSWSLPDLEPDGRTSIDYALVSRVFHPDTGMPLLQACGITQYGCQSAGEFLTNPAYFAQVLPRLPKGWERRNVQVVLTSRILRDSPGAPRVIAVHVW
jgi:hypothetical protein